MKKFIFFFSILFLSACAGSDVYTLYRDSPGVLGSNVRIHVATFDANEGEIYNLDDCNIAKNLFINNAAVSVDYWCEKGRYKK
jgi:hypothetical protein